MKTVAQFLLNQLKLRQQKNKKYSQRAFARDLNISPGRLSDVLNGKTTIGVRLTGKIISNLKLNDAEAQTLKSLLKQQTANKKTLGNFNRHLSEDEYALIAQPKHYYLLALLETSGQHYSLEWIARRLGITVAETQEMIERLLSLKMIRRDPKSRFKTVPGGATTTHDIPSEVIRESHRAVILDSLKRLETEPVQARDFSSITMATNPAKIVAAKKLINEFRNRLCKLLETGKKSEVYTLNIQLFRNTLPE